LLNKYLSKIFLLIISSALFLDAINVDAIFTSHAMIREEYEGESSEIYSFPSEEQIISTVHFCTTENLAYEPADDSSKPIFLIDEDSYSLAAKPIIIDEGLLSLWTNPNTRQTTPCIHLFNFYSLCKLQI
jgi:hypothetical protein